MLSETSGDFIVGEQPARIPTPSTASTEGQFLALFMFCALSDPTLLEQIWGHHTIREAETTWRRHSCLPRPDSSGRLPGVLQNASRRVGTQQSESLAESLRHSGTLRPTR